MSITVSTGADARRLQAHANGPRVGRLRALRRNKTSYAARRVAMAIFHRMTVGRLVIEERLPDCPVAQCNFGPGDSPGDVPGVFAHVIVHDLRAYGALLGEGAAGLGRGFFEGWWSSEDPVAVVRVAIRNVQSLDDLRNRLHRVTGWATDRIRMVLPRDSRRRNSDDIGAHYDIGNAFFELFLDDTLTYSSAVFPTLAATLAEASVHKYDLLLGKLDLQAGHRLLEIGTGWGGLAMRATQTTDCTVTTTTISAEQLALASQRVADAGLQDRIRLLDRDWRDLPKLQERFDRVISIEMIEAVDWRDYDAYFSTIERCLASDGLVAIQAICYPDKRYARAKNTVDFIRRFVFPNGFLPSVGAINASVARGTKMQVIGVEDFTAHYAETLHRWRERFDGRQDEVRALGLDDRFCRLWRFYFAYCEAGFLERQVNVVQLVFAGQGWRGSPQRP